LIEHPQLSAVLKDEFLVDKSGLGTHDVGSALEVATFIALINLKPIAAVVMSCEVLEVILGGRAKHQEIEVGGAADLGVLLGFIS
jgi:hypothetical protein